MLSAAVLFYMVSFIVSPHAEIGWPEVRLGFEWRAWVFMQQSSALAILVQQGRKDCRFEPNVDYLLVGRSTPVYNLDGLHPERNDSLRYFSTL